MLQLNPEPRARVQHHEGQSQRLRAAEAPIGVRSRQAAGTASGKHLPHTASGSPLKLPGAGVTRTPGWRAPIPRAPARLSHTRLFRFLSRPASFPTSKLTGSLPYQPLFSSFLESAQGETPAFLFRFPLRPHVSQAFRGGQGGGGGRGPRAATHQAGKRGPPLSRPRYPATSSPSDSLSVTSLPSSISSSETHSQPQR